jgi:hypothetical protein
MEKLSDTFAREALLELRQAWQASEQFWVAGCPSCRLSPSVFVVGSCAILENRLHRVEVLRVGNEPRGYVFFLGRNDAAFVAGSASGADQNSRAPE